MRTGRRKLFNRAAQAEFLEWFAATCNVSWSAEMAGFNYKTVLRHRMNDPVFAEGWDRAVRQGYARLEAQQLETKAKEAPIGIEGDWDAPAMDPVDPQLAIQLLREHKRDVAGPHAGPGAPRKQGRRPQVATNAEVRAALEKRLKAFHARERARQCNPLPLDGGGREGVAPEPSSVPVVSPPPPQPAPIEGEGERH